MTDLTPAVWFPAVRTGTGTDVFTERLVTGLRKRGVRAEITWLPLRAEYAPWTLAAPAVPDWANVAHVNTWLHPRFVPSSVPVMATIHHAVHHPGARAYKGLVRAAYHRGWIAPNERRVLHRADRVIAVSHFVADTTRRTLADVPMQVIHNGIDTELFRPAGFARPVRTPLRLLYVGSWMARKGVDLLAPVMRALGGEFELRYTGGAAAERDKPRMPSNMHDIGRLVGESAIVAEMHDADALLFPTRSEGHPLVAIEAMACGLPVVASSGSSFPEIIENGVTGLLCEQNNVLAFVEAVRSLAVSRSRLGTMSQAARESVAFRFGLPAMVDNHIAVYLDLLGGKSNLLQQHAVA